MAKTARTITVPAVVQATGVTQPFTLEYTATITARIRSNVKVFHAECKKWTVLFYANGNNDLEPEMRYAMNELDTEAQHVHVALQIGRERYDIVRLLRPCSQAAKPPKDWAGVRRFALKGKRLVPLEDLGKVNMAHPAILADFLVWGFKHFPAEKYMLVAGGHSWQFLGMMTDYSQDKPYIMGIPGLANAVNAAGSQIGLPLDLIVLDTCNCNTIEVLYEMGANPAHSVKHLITHVGQAPLKGLSFRDIVQQTEALSDCKSTSEFIAAFLSRLSNGLLACTIDHKQLEDIKELFSRLAIEYCYWSMNEVNFQQLLDACAVLNPWHKQLAALHQMMKNVIIWSSHPCAGTGIIGVANVRTANLDSIRAYSMLSFAKNNYWTHLVGNISRQELLAALAVSTPFAPLKLSRQEVCRFIALVNPGFSTEQTQGVFHRLARLKHWEEEK